MMIEKRIPVRRCAGCMEHSDKKELLRLAKNKDGEISFDLSGKNPGRGAYICRNMQCLAKARKKRGFERALKLKGEVPHEIYEKIEREIGTENQFK